MNDNSFSSGIGGVIVIVAMFATLALVGIVINYL